MVALLPKKIHRYFYALWYKEKHAHCLKRYNPAFYSSFNGAIKSVPVAIQTPEMNLGIIHCVKFHLLN